MNIDTYTKDRACVYQTLCEEKEYGVRDDTSWCYDEARCGECDSCDEHRDCRIDLDVSSSFFGHVVLDYISMVQR
ncbi:hypothetical protein [Xylanibacter ruminicola]|uniref:hypothetical protein n=1 Tax=Xylanibacter ruminicola TaxID=839 RepID=UPI00115FE25C|nr:hypothetical protein [Xylanibacter ruminicola]